MEISINFILITHLIALILGILSASVILYFGFKSNPANQPLGIAQLSISLGIWVSFTIVSHLIFEMPYLYRTGQIFALIFVPMPFLHTIFYTRKRSWKWFDMLHAIPLLIYLVDYWGVLVLPMADKIALIKLESHDLDLVGQFRESRYFGPGFHQEFRTIVFSAYWVAQFVVLFRWIRIQSSFTTDMKVWRNWMLIFLAIQFFMWFPFYLRLLGLDILTTYHIVNSLSVVGLMLSSISLFFYPSILYGPRKSENYSDATKTIGSAKVPLSAAELLKLEETILVIETQLLANEYFLLQGYSINDFSKDIQIPVYQISKSLNTFKGLGFNDYINQKRIGYCVQKFEQGEWLNFTVEAVASECGFNNRNSFTNAFKKFLGASPSAYRENIKK